MKFWQFGNGNLNITMIGILIPFLGTVLSSVCVFFMKKKIEQIHGKSIGRFCFGSHDGCFDLKSDHPRD